jgi:hypothetical protein
MDGMSGEIVRRCGYDWWLKPPNDYPLYALPPTCLVLLDTSYHTSCAGCAAAAAGGGAARREGDADGKRGHDMHEDGMATPWRTTTSERAKRFSPHEAKGGPGSPSEQHVAQSGLGLPASAVLLRPRFVRRVAASAAQPERVAL